MSLSLVKKECANYDYHYGGCLFEEVEGVKLDKDQTCLIQQKAKCPYFEAVVLKTRSLANHCNDCRTEIPQGRRYCQKCLGKRRRVTWRNQKRKARSDKLG